MSGFEIEEWPLPYVERLAARDPADIDLVVVHCTELPDLAMAREYGERILHGESRTGNSGHYYIDLDGRTFRFVPDARIAHHVSGCNERSLGIELVNPGRYPHWRDSRHQAFTTPYAPAQIDALRRLLATLRSAHEGLRWIAGHEDLDRRLEPAEDDPAVMLRRRQDPGPLFPWGEVLPASGLERFTGA